MDEIILEANEKMEKTIENLLERFKSHNFLSKKGFTTKYRPWTVIHIEFFENKNEAIAREKFLKTGSGREFRDSILKHIPR